MEHKRLKASEAAGVQGSVGNPSWIITTNAMKGYTKGSQRNFTDNYCSTRILYEKIADFCLYRVSVVGTESREEVLDVETIE